MENWRGFESFFSRVSVNENKLSTLTIHNVNNRLVPAIIGKNGNIHQSLVRNYHLHYIHITDPFYVSDEKERVGLKSNILIAAYNKMNIFSVVKEIMTLLKKESERYMDVNFRELLNNV